MRNAMLQLRWLVPLVAVGLGLCSGPALAAQEPAAGPVEPHPEAVEAIGRLKSPYCPGFMLEVCPSPQAAELRDTIEALARSGMESQELVEWVLSRHGEEWRALPRTEGKGLVAWLVPPGALLLGVGLVVLVLWKLRGSGRFADGYAGDEPDLSDADERRLARAVREFDAE